MGDEKINISNSAIENSINLVNLQKKFQLLNMYIYITDKKTNTQISVFILPSLI